MIYSLYIGIAPRGDVAETKLEPITIKTIKTSRPEVADEEIEAVAEFFKQQIKSSIVALVRG